MHGRALHQPEHRRLDGLLPQRGGPAGAAGAAAALPVCDDNAEKEDNSQLDLDDDTSILVSEFEDSTHAVIDHTADGGTAAPSICEHVETEDNSQPEPNDDTSILVSKFEDWSWVLPNLVDAYDISIRVMTIAAEILLGTVAALVLLASPWVMAEGAVKWSSKVVKRTGNKLLVLLFVALQLMPTVHGQGQNLAFNQPTSQSSEGWGGAASRGVDGTTHGSWGMDSCTHTDNPTDDP
eukprot:SAG22_NODE_5924_length_930_cov_1.312876_1_plen_236_part_01